MSDEDLERMRRSLATAPSLPADQVRLLIDEVERLRHPPGPGDAVSGTGLWEDGMVRVFLSHSAVHKAFVAEVAERLRAHGLNGFVAHDAIEVTREWQIEIERALRTADLFVGLVHPEFVQSPWANQEVGWAYGRGLPTFMIRLGVDPQGFPSKKQWQSMVAERPDAVAGRIAQWVNTLDAFSDTIGGRLIAALRDAANYQDAGQAAEALNRFDTFSPEQWKDLDRAYLDNDQVHRGVLAQRGLKPLYARNKRELPDRQASR